MPEYVYRVEDHRVFLLLLLPLVWWHQKRVVRPLHYCNDLLASDNCGATEREGEGAGERGWGARTVGWTCPGRGYSSCSSVCALLKIAPNRTKKEKGKGNRNDVAAAAAA